MDRRLINSGRRCLQRKPGCEKTGSRDTHGRHDARVKTEYADMPDRKRHLMQGLHQVPFLVCQVVISQTRAS